MAFTPLVSPAVTPLDPHFNMDGGFTVPGAYFSPLTSPALRAQGDHSLIYDHSTHSNNSPVEHSPVTIDSAMTIEPSVSVNQGTGLDLSKKARKNNAAKARAKSTLLELAILEVEESGVGRVELLAVDDSLQRLVGQLDSLGVEQLG